MLNLQIIDMQKSNPDDVKGSRCTKEVPKLLCVGTFSTLAVAVGLASFSNFAAPQTDVVLQTEKMDEYGTRNEVVPNDRL
jgi:hypothetical protein